MSTSSDPQSPSESESSWWTPSTWVPDVTQDSPSTLSTLTPHPDWSSESDPPTSSWSWTWIETDLSTAARMTGAGPPSTSTFTLSTLSSSPTLLIATQTSQTGSTGQILKSTAVKFRSGHIVAITFAVLLAMASLFIYLLIRFRMRKLGHQRLYSGPDENLDDDSLTMALLKNTGRNGGGEAFGVSAAVGMRGRMGSTREFTPTQALGWYHNEWRSLSDGENSPILQPSLSQSDSPASASSPERGTSSLGLNNVHESPTVQSRSSILIVKETYGPLSPLDPPRYSQILPMKPNLRPPRLLPVPRNPRPLLPQRRVDSIQVRKQNKPPLISSLTASLPLPSSPPTLSSAPSSTGPGQGLGALPVPEKSPPPLPQRRTHGTQAPLSSWSLSNPSVTPLAPLRPTPAVSFKHISQTKHRTVSTD